MPKEPLTVKEYADLGYKQLHRELKKMVDQAQRMTVWFNVDKQLRLLPALMAMKGLVAQPGRRYIVAEQPSWEDECPLLGLTAEQVRQWKHRTASETDIRALVGQDGYHRKRPVSVAPTKEFHHLIMLTRAVLDGDDKGAERLAHGIAEEYGI